ncbi:hypothetical protein LIER_14312 [Lithospermum erythrorhizon]|uniref:TOD1/MUCI70 glycosyltransferase-like domain-containing protein n=1 Tax=Lithospermum erythrorhizon TaxID=34254 RepID=A0AAV3Q0A0_LITER
MAQFRQSNDAVLTSSSRNGVVSDQHVAIGIRSSTSHKQPRHQHRRLKSSGSLRKISVAALIVFLLIAFFASILAFFYLSQQNREIISYQNEEDNDTDFLTDVTRTEKPKVLKFGQGSVKHGKDSRYWDRDDRRRDEDYSDKDLEQIHEDSINKDHVSVNVKNSDSLSTGSGSNNGVHKKNSVLYNEAGRDELKRYEAEYEASMKSIRQSNDVKKLGVDPDVQAQNENIDADDGYDDGMDLQDAQMDDDSKDLHENEQQSDILEDGESSLEFSRRNVEEANESFRDLSVDEFSAGSRNPDKVQTKSGHVNLDSQSIKKSTTDKKRNTKKKPKRRRNSGTCEMKLLNSSALLIEPLEGRKFARFSLQYTDKEEKPNELENWEPRFAGHQSLQEREQSFIAHDQKINCGFVKGPNTTSSGFDIAEDDAKYMSSCHIAVGSCIFGNSDRLRSPVGKMVSKLSRKNVCFVMFVDETTLRTLIAEGQILDGGFIGLWRVVVVKNLPYTDMRRVGKIPKFLSHRLFPSARYSIWLDSKLRLQLDPLTILELFLWRKGFEYAISNHYDRHCVWEEVAQNKKLNKYNHSVIDEQFAFYQADGLRRFDASDPQNLLPSNVPEGSLIIRAHTPMSNLFSCLWFNEVERFTPRDQLSFAYTYYKLRRTNPEKPFYLKMFKDCERRKIAKLFRHRPEEKRTLPQHES